MRYSIALAVFGAIVALLLTALPSLSAGIDGVRMAGLLLGGN
jgi:hypothetical protein